MLVSQLNWQPVVITKKEIKRRTGVLRIRTQFRLKRACTKLEKRMTIIMNKNLFSLINVQPRFKSQIRKFPLRYKGQFCFLGISVSGCKKMKQRRHQTFSADHELSVNEGTF